MHTDDDGEFSFRYLDVDVSENFRWHPFSAPGKGTVTYFSNCFFLLSGGRGFSDQFNILVYVLRGARTFSWCTGYLRNPIIELYRWMYQPIDFRKKYLIGVSFNGNELFFQWYCKKIECCFQLNIYSMNHGKSVDKSSIFYRPQNIDAIAICNKLPN